MIYLQKYLMKDFSKAKQDCHGTTLGGEVFGKFLKSRK